MSFFLYYFSYIILFLLMQQLFWLFLVRGLMNLILIMIFVFCSVSYFLLVQKLEFFALIYLLIYASAILTLFIFIMLMLDISGIFIEKEAFSGEDVIVVFFILDMLNNAMQLMMEMPIISLRFEENYSLKWKNYIFLIWRKVDIYSRGFYDFALDLFSKYNSVVILLGIFLLIALIGATMVITDFFPMKKS